MKAIGFANKFYTLWEVTKDTVYYNNGRHEEITKCNYIKNISFDKETAMKAYPGVEFDESLKGHTRSWESVKIIWDNVNTFRFGKYSGMKIDDVYNNSYLEWYWNNIYGDHRDYVSSVLESRGYEIRKFNSGTEYIVSPEFVEAEKIHNAKVNEFVKKLEANKPLDVITEYNPNDEGEIVDDYATYKFAEVKENYYRGFTYYLPVLNGKAKRIKNKNLIIKKYTYMVENNNITVNILDFEVKK